MRSGEGVSREGKTWGKVTPRERKKEFQNLLLLMKLQSNYKNSDKTRKFITFDAVHDV